MSFICKENMRMRFWKNTISVDEPTLKDFTPRYRRLG